MAKNPNKIRAKRVASDYVIDIIMIVTIVLVLVLTLYPFLNSLAISLNDSNDTTLGGLTIYPRKFTWRNYELVFTNEKIWMAYFITIARTVIGTVGGVLITGMLAFAISRTNLVGKKVYAGAANVFDDDVADMDGGDDLRCVDGFHAVENFILRDVRFRAHSDSRAFTV